MVCHDYLQDDAEAMVSGCSCFLYDVHAPGNCRMGAVYVISSFGGGQDPWLWMSFLSCALFMLAWRFHKDKTRHKEMSLGRVIFEEKLWGLGFVGGSLFLAFLILILSRIAFAATPRNISRNVNVILSPLFYSSMFGLIVGITNCWFVLIFRAHEDLYKEKLPIPFPGLFRKSLHLLGRKVPTGTNFQLVLKTVGLTFEAVTLANILMFVIASFILGISSTQQLDSSKTHTGYLGSSWVFGLSFTVFVLDAALAQGIHRYHGLKFRVPTEYTSWTMWNQDQQAGRTSREWKSGQDQSRMEQRDSLFLMRMLMAGQLLISLILRLVSGYCPYQDYHEDIYHGER